MRGDPGRRRLWVFDFDGTLSPIVPDRSAAKVHPACRDLLRDLASQAGQTVAVLSSRALTDLVPRVPVPRVVLGGGSGVEWRGPRGRRMGMGRDAEARIESTRRALLPLLRDVAAVPGAEIEDKHWSIAIHYRKVSRAHATALEPLLGRLRVRTEIRVFDGPCVAEVQLLPEVDKALGIRRLCQFLRFDPCGGGVVYAGDDENDAVAMRWVLARKGTAIAVGGRTRVPGARAVAGPASLARAVRALAGISPACGGGGDGKGAPG